MPQYSASNLPDSYPQRQERHWATTSSQCAVPRSSASCSNKTIPRRSGKDMKPAMITDARARNGAMMPWENGRCTILPQTFAASAPVQPGYHRIASHRRQGSRHVGSPLVGPPSPPPACGTDPQPRGRQALDFASNKTNKIERARVESLQREIRGSKSC